MKRYQVVSTMRTTGAAFVHVDTDSPAEALAAAKKLDGARANNVLIRDAIANKFSKAEAFAVEHRLAN